MYIEQEDILKHISAKPFHLISEAADELGVEAYVIGGYVRDIFLHRPSKDIDVVAIGSGIELAKAVARKLGREGLTLMRQVEQKEAERNLAFCDSLIPVKQQELEGLKKGFNFEKDSAYNEIGNYVSKQQTIERNIQRCYIRSGVNEKGEMYLASVYFGGKPINHTGIKLSTQDGLFAETPAIPYDGGLNYHFKDLGNTTEVVTYQGEKCEDAVKFIFANKEKRIKVEYTGGKPYILYIADADKKAIASTYELAVVLSDIEKLTKEKEKATKKLAYLEKKLSGEK